MMTKYGARPDQTAKTASGTPGKFEPTTPKPDKPEKEPKPCTQTT